MYEEKLLSLQCTSVLAPCMADFVEQKRALGNKYNACVEVFNGFDRFCNEQHLEAPVISKELLSLWEENTLKLAKYEKETIILTSEGDDTYNVYTFNSVLKRRLTDFAKKYPDLCRLESEDKKVGYQSYIIDKARLSIRITAPYSEERKNAARERAKRQSNLIH